MKVQHDIDKVLIEDRGVALVLLDLGAAFDTINTKCRHHSSTSHWG